MPTLSRTAVEASPVTSPIPIIRTVLRLLGFLSANPEGDLPAAKRACCRTLGFPDEVSHDDAALLGRLRPILEARGLGQFYGNGLYDEVPHKSGLVPCVLAGSIFRAGRCDGIGVRAERIDIHGNAIATLAETTTTAHGQYAICLMAPEHSLFSVRFSQAEQTLHQSPPRLVAEDQWVEWAAQGDTVPPPGRFEIREAALHAALATQGLTFRGTLDSIDPSMIQGLAQLSGLSEDLVLHHVVAARLGSELRVASSVISALLGTISAPWNKNGSNGSPTRESSPIDDALQAALTCINAQSADYMERRLSEAEAAGELSQRAKPQTRRLLDAVNDALNSRVKRRTKEDAAETQRPSEKGSSWAELLSAAGVPTDRIRDMASALSRKDEVRAWQIFEASAHRPGRASARTRQSLTAKQVKDALDIASLANHDARVIRPLRKETPRSVARMTEPMLDQQLQTAYPSKSERRQVIAGLHERSDRAYPGDALLRRRLPRLNGATRIPLERFLQRAGDTFDLLDHSVDRAFEADITPRAKRNKIEQDHHVLRSELLQLQRVVRVTRDAGIADLLLERHYSSAQSIALTDRDTFVAELTQCGVSREDAERVYRRARAHYRATVETYLRYNLSANGPPLAVLKGPGLAALERVTSRGDSTNQPTWAKLFGSPDYSPCEEWESVLGQPAYLVDLLVWLYKFSEQVPYKAVRSRRPDVVKVLLNKENATVKLPYIDIVCELLEDAVAQKLRLASIGPDARQTTRSEEEIRAYPEYVNYDVYKSLSTSTASMALPFDLPLEEVRAYLALKTVNNEPVTRVQLLQLFQASQEEIAAETLGLTLTEFDLLTREGSDPGELEKKRIAVWGAKRISEVAEFLRRAPSPKSTREHLTYAEAESVLNTTFVQKTQPITIQLKKEKPDTCKAEDREIVPPLEVELDRVHQLIRLARRSGWSFVELDLLIQGLGGMLNKDCLVGMASISTFQKQLSLTVEELSAFFRDFEAQDATSTPRKDGSVSLYARLFLSRSDATPPEFRDAEFTPKTIASHTEFIASALEVPTSELMTWMTQHPPKPDTLPLKILSELYRYTRLAKALKRSLTHLDLLMRTIGDPFEGNGHQRAQSLSRFLERLAVIDAAQLSVEDLASVTGRISLLLPERETLEKSLKELVSATRSLLEAAAEKLAAEKGEQPEQIDDKNVKATMLATAAWAPLITGWIGLDTRFSKMIVDLDNALNKKIFDGVLNGNEDAFQALGRLQRWVTSLRITPLEAESACLLPGWMEFHVAVFEKKDQINSGELTVALRWQNLARATSGISSLAQFFQAIANSKDFSQWVAKLASSFMLESSRTELAWKALNPSTDVAHAKDPVFLEKVRATVQVSLALGVEPDLIRQWAAGWPNSEITCAVRNAVRATLSREAWLLSSSKVQNRLREKKRDALIAFLHASEGPELVASPATRLSEQFLIDVEMGGERDTTRIVQAVAAIQRFVQQCLLGLEPNVLLNPDQAAGPWKQWEWRKRHNLWAANRLIFLIPENYLDIGERSNASPLFRQLQKKILEGEINPENVAAATEEYLTELEKISRLTYEAIDVSDKPGPVLGVLARTGGNPPTYYYRRFFDHRWSPWEEVSLGPTAAQPALGQGTERAWIVWPSITDYLHPEQDLPPATETGSAPTQRAKSLSYVRYSWTMRDDRGTWSLVKTTSRAMVMTARDRRQLLPIVGPEFPSQSEFTVELYSAPPTGSESVSFPKLLMTGFMGIARDTTAVQVDPTATGVGLPKKDDGKLIWRDHEAELKLSIDANKESNPKQLEPWSGLFFDNNRMIRDASGGDELKVPSSILDGNGTEKFGTKLLLSVPGPLVITRSSDRMDTPISTVDQPSPYAFLATTANLSVLFLSTEAQEDVLPEKKQTPNKYVAIPAYHPFTSELLSLVRAKGLREICQYDIQNDPTLLRTDLVNYRTALNLSPDVVMLPTDKTNPPTEALDFDPRTPYGLYNYEIFCYIPLLVALRLSSQKRYDSAQSYFHLVFNPQNTEPGTSPDRFWITKPFREPQVELDVEQVLVTSADTKKNPWLSVESNEFDAWAVAEEHLVCLQKYVVRTYLDNLISWADDLYRKGNREDVDEAIPLYELAQKILGDRPNQVPPIGRRPVRAFEAPGKTPDEWFGGSNILVELESLYRDAGDRDGSDSSIFLPLMTWEVEKASRDGKPAGLYFRVPPNKQLLGYWDKVETRLHNIRASRTMSGGTASLAIESAPIDIKALAAAAALGISVADALEMAEQPPSRYRFRTMLSKAQEYCNDARSLGAAVLTILEKRDSEYLATIRTKFEGPVLEASRQTKEKQKEQAGNDLASLIKARELAADRQDFYKKRDRRNWWEIASTASSITAGAMKLACMGINGASGAAYLIPDIDVGVTGAGGTPVAKVKIGGKNVGESLSKWALALSIGAELLDRSAAGLSTEAGYQRREEDWDHQEAQAELECEHFDKQIAAAKVRIEIAKAELAGHDQQENAWRENDRVLREKFTNGQLYDWYLNRLNELFRQSYNLALRQAKIARRCFRIEVGTEAKTEIKKEWDVGKAGLLAGEQLSQQLRELELEYLAEPLSTSVVTQHISLAQVAPQALLRLLETGTTTETFTIPGWWFKRLYPDLRCRRIRSLTVSIPCVTGPYVNVNATVTFKGPGSSPSGINTISLSHANRDAGWDLSVRNEQYAPFEGIVLDQGTNWLLNFPEQEQTDIDVQNVTDVIFHIEYEAKVGDDGVVDPKNSRPANWRIFLDVARMAADEWQQLLTSAKHDCILELADFLPMFLREHYKVTPGEIDSESVALLDRSRNSYGVKVRAEDDSPVGRLVIEGVDSQSIPWSDLRHLLIAVPVQYHGPAPRKQGPVEILIPPSRELGPQQHHRSRKHKAGSVDRKDSVKNKTKSRLS